MSSTPTPAAPAWPELQRTRRAIAVLDVVESVRLMQEDESGFIGRWQRFVAEVEDRLLPAHGGRLVKSLGDGLLAELDTAAGALRFAAGAHAAAAALCEGVPQAQRIVLRVGVNIDDVVVGRHDVFGNGVNVAARLAGIAQPGDTVISAPVRDQVAHGLEFALVDLGECYLKHIEQPMRAFCVRPAGGTAQAAALQPAWGLQPGIAVLPLRGDPADPGAALLGDALADDIITGLSGTGGLRVVSRLSTLAFAEREPSTAQLKDTLGVAYVLSGRFGRGGGQVHVRVQLADVRDGSVLWGGGFRLAEAEALADTDELVSAVVAEVGQRILAHELQRARTLPFRALDLYSLYAAGIGLLYRLSRADFERAHGLFDHLSERQPRNAVPHAMKARWHVLRMMQGWSADSLQEARLARANAQRALGLDERNALGLAVDGLVAAHADGDVDTAFARCDAAVLADPQDAYAWMVLSGALSYQGQGAQAVAAAERALALTPLDPARFQFEAYLAMAHLAAGRHEDAVRWAESSLALNATLTGTMRIRIIALALAGQGAAAREGAAQMLRLQPHYTVGQYLDRYPGRQSAHAPLYAQALRDSGVPA